MRRQRAVHRVDGHPRHVFVIVSRPVEMLGRNLRSEQGQREEDRRDSALDRASAERSSLIDALHGVMVAPPGGVNGRSEAPPGDR